MGLQHQYSNQQLLIDDKQKRGKNSSYASASNSSLPGKKYREEQRKWL